LVAWPLKTDTFLSPNAETGFLHFEEPCPFDAVFEERESNGAVPLTDALITVTDLDVWKKLGFHRESFASFVLGLIHPSERSERILTV
jgi:hypothetical protein